MLAAYHDGKVYPANTVTDFSSPVLVYAMLHRPIRDAKWRFGILGLRDQVAPQVLIVVIVKAYEYSFRGHRLFLLLDNA